MIEVRRAEDGIRTWAAEPGEYYHSFNGEFGGLWRRNGRPPNVVVRRSASPPRASTSAPTTGASPAASIRAPRSSSRASTTEIIGDFGLIGGGAAGLELDRADHALGTPPNPWCWPQLGERTPT